MDGTKPTESKGTRPSCSQSQQQDFLCKSRKHYTVHSHESPKDARKVSRPNLSKKNSDIFDSLSMFVMNENNERLRQKQREAQMTELSGEQEMRGDSKTSNAGPSKTLVLDTKETMPIHERLNQRKERCSTKCKNLKDEKFLQEVQPSSPKSCDQGPVAYVSLNSRLQDPLRLVR